MGVPGGEPVRFASYLGEPRELDSVVRELQAMQRTTGLEWTLAIGGLEHPECPLSRAAINQSIGIFVIVESLPCVRTFSHIGSAHVAAVFHLDKDAQRDWLERAERGSWGVRQPRDEVTRHRRESGERRGRPKASWNPHVLSNIRSIIGDLEQAVARLDDARWQLLDRSELAPIVDRLAVVESALLGSLQRPLKSEPRVTPIGIAKSRSKQSLEDLG